LLGVRSINNHSIEGENQMAINETVTGNDSIAITGTASAGERTVGVKGIGDSVGVQGKGKAWHGVEGISDSTIGGFGVYGANTAGGTGVVGESKGWMGVYGKSESTTGGAGVMGEGDPAPGVIGKSTKWIDVYGETAGIENGPAGMWGEHKGAGIGVKAISNTGVGLVAFSNGIAAVFQGDVEVTGNLTVNGFIFMGGDTVNPLAGWIERIRHLEAEVADLRSKLSSSGQSSGTTTATATIGVDLTLRPGPFNDLRVFGSGFAPNEAIEISVTSTSTGGGGGSSTTAATADSSGKFSHTVGVSCPSGLQTTHIAFARGVSSGRISNKASTSC
jgi:hypothetical protein